MFHKCIKKVNKIAIAEEAEMKFLIRKYMKGIISSGQNEHGAPNHYFMEKKEYVMNLVE
ncbi:hypothetical protein ABEX53_31625 [Bacillus toyonensis]|uniref:hypothetical protein n=1 Tax=Bacillus toyonensis TaxID=155322 RepID=UPI0015E1ABD5|nr:hypothetical protein [Bacillus toyonensis]MED3540636.1 hypothetical protein [Bacillus toyonensis]